MIEGFPGFYQPERKLVVLDGLAIVPGLFASRSIGLDPGDLADSLLCDF